ncbi:MAG: hypothetical protein WCW31_01225 [Patescibacteria group bacterium]
MNKQSAIFQMLSRPDFPAKQAVKRFGRQDVVQALWHLYTHETYYPVLKLAIKLLEKDLANKAAKCILKCRYSDEIKAFALNYFKSQGIDPDSVD